jgi:hypothetical protein
VASGLAVTLTYPKAVPDREKANRDRVNFVDRLRRKFPQASGYWALEYQSRGAAHYHLLVLGVDAAERASFRAWTAAAWTAVVASPDPNHAKSGTSVCRVRNGAKYCSYLSKKGDGTRSWGAFNSKALPLSAKETIHLTGPQASKVRRWIRHSERATAPSWKKGWRRKGQSNPAVHHLTNNAARLSAAIHGAMAAGIL